MSDPVTMLLASVRSHARAGLRPLVSAIDRQGFYPQAWLQELGALGGLTPLAAAPTATPASFADWGHARLATQIAVIDAVGAECGATAFTLWCQSACAWYLDRSSNAALRAHYAPQLAQGTLLAGTGMSNTVKHLSGIEKHLLQAVPADGGGWHVSGSLPWVSNLGAEHVFACSAQLPDGGYVMFVLHGDAPGVSLHACPEFCALEGTRTVNVRLDKAFVSPDAVLARPEQFASYLQSIKPGFILLQNGIAQGVIEGCLKIIRESQLTANPCNDWLDDGIDSLQPALDALRAQTQSLAQQAQSGTVSLLEVLRSRLQASELALRAAQSAALHTGARGYLMRHSAQRRSREALFVAIVTPALKQLRRDIARLEQQQQQQQTPQPELALAA